jgi:hypothetical protein
MGQSNNWMTLPVMSTSAESFKIQTARSTLHFNDEDLKPNAEGKYIINIEKIDLGSNCGTIKEFEMPLEIMEHRKERRRLNALEKNTIHIDSSVDPILYFYLEGDKLRILQGEKEVIIDHIEILYGKKVVNVDGLDWQPYLELPANVVEPFEKALREKELERLSLVFRGRSRLDGWDYYGFNMDPSNEQWSTVQQYFVGFGTDDETLYGWLTWNPKVVANTLGIPIEAGQ